MSTQVMSTDANNNTDALTDKLEACTLESSDLISNGDANNNKPTADTTSESSGTGDADAVLKRAPLASGTDLATITETADVENISNGEDDAFEEGQKTPVQEQPETEEVVEEVEETAENDVLAQIAEPLPQVDSDGCHPLEREWTWWFLNGDKPKNNDKNKGRDMGSDWNSGLLQVYKFSTVEDFWAVFNHMQSPAKLRLKNDYMVFQSGVRPEWEDPHNAGGGMWKIILPSKMRAEHLDRLWIEILLSMIGESYGEAGQLVCGAYLQRRQKEDRIQLWTTSGSEEDICHIGQTLKTVLNLGKESPIHYLAHETANGGNNGKHRSWTSRAKTNCLYTV